MENQNKINVIVINHNNIEWNNDTDVNNLNQLESELSKYVTVKTINVDELMETIVLSINLNQDLLGDSTICYQTSNNVYQVCYISYDEKTDKDTLCVNKIASCLCNDTIYGNAVLINSKISDNSTCIPDTLCIKDMVNIFYSKFIHKAIFIPCDNSNPVVEYNYSKSPLEYYGNHNNNNFKTLEFEFMDFNLSMFCKTEIEDDAYDNKINKRATRIYGKQSLIGDIILFSLTDKEFIDVSLELYNKIVKLSYGPMKQRQITSEERKENEKINNLPVVMNRYRILDNRFIKCNLVCSYCQKDLIEDKLNECSGCYRMKYHNDHCQKQHWNEHKFDCLHYKKIIKTEN